MNRKTEILIGSLIVILLVSFLGFKFLGNKYDRDSALSKIDEAILSGDMDYLAKHIEVRGLGRDLTEEEVRSIHEVLKDISVYSLNDQKDDPEANIYIMQKGKEKLFFDKYIIALKPYSLVMEPNMEGTEIFINDEKVGDFKENEEFLYDNLLPGVHKIKLLYQGDYAKLEEEEEITAFRRDGSNEIHSYLQIHGQYIYVESNLEDATLLIDGEDTGIKIYDGYDLGPVDGKKRKIAARVELDGQEYLSETKEISEDSSSSQRLNIDYEPPMSEEEIFGEIEKLIENYEINLIKAVNYGSYSYLENYIEFGSPFMKAQKKLIDNLYENGTKEELLAFQIENTNIVADDQVFVTVSESHMIIYKDGEKKEVNNKWTYELTNKDDKFLIRNLEKAK